MKRNSIIFCALSALLFAGCESESSLLENHLFIDASSFKNEIRLALDEGVTEAEGEINIAMASTVSQDVNINFIAEPSLLETFREAYYSPDALLLPEQYYDLSETKTLIRTGNVKGDVKVEFKNLGSLDLDGKDYVLPVTMMSDEVKTLDRAKTMYFVVKKAALVNAVADLNSNCAWPEFKDFTKVENMEQFTMECLINCHAFNNESSIHTVMGIEDHFLIRIGDANKAKNWLHVAAGYSDKKNGSYYRASIPTTDAVAPLLLKKDRWYHIAVTFDNGEVKLYLDGIERASGNIKVLATVQEENPETGEKVPVDYGVEKVNLMIPHSDEIEQPRCFWLGYSYDFIKEGKMNRCLDGMMAEARIWGRVLSKEEINAENHFYKIYPEKDGQFSEDLLAYWRFDDAKGKVVKDHSRYGHDLTGFANFVWYPVELPVK